MQSYHIHKHQRVAAMLAEFRKWRWSMPDAVAEVANIMHISQDYVWRLSYQKGVTDLALEEWPHADLDRLYVEGIVHKHTKALKEKAKQADKPKQQPKSNTQIQQPKLFDENENH